MLKLPSKRKLKKLLIKPLKLKIKQQKKQVKFQNQLQRLYMMLKTVEVASNAYNAAVHGAEVVAEKAVELKDAAVEGGKNLYNKTA